MRDQSKMRLPIILIYVWIIVFAHTASANELYESHDNIVLHAKTFLDQQIRSSHQGDYQINLGKIDQRLLLRACSTALDFSLNRGFMQYSAITLGVHCKSTSPWTIYIPSQIVLYKSVAVANNTLYKSQELSRADVTLVKKEINQSGLGHFDNIEQVLGKTARRVILSGTVLGPQNVDEALMVRRGQLVTLVAESSGFQVKMNGRALSSGSRGHLIKVENNSSKRIIEGTIIAEGLVRVNP